jgi:exonuclease VII large subunit
MPFNQNSNFMQQMRQNNQRFHKFAQQNNRRQQDQFNRTARQWNIQAQQRGLQQQQQRAQQQRAQFQSRQNIRYRQSQPPSVASSSGWRPTAQSQPLSSRRARCRRCWSPLYPGLRTCPGCGASTARARGRALWAVTFIALLLGLVILAAAAAHTSARPSKANSQAPVTSSSQGHRLPQPAGEAALASARTKISDSSTFKETVS